MLGTLKINFYHYKNLKEILNDSLYKFKLGLVYLHTICLTQNTVLIFLFFQLLYLEINQANNLHLIILTINLDSLF